MLQNYMLKTNWKIPDHFDFSEESMMMTDMILNVPNLKFSNHVHCKSPYLCSETKHLHWLQYVQHRADWFSKRCRFASGAFSSSPCVNLCTFSLFHQIVPSSSAAAVAASSSCWCKPPLRFFTCQWRPFVLIQDRTIL